MFSSLSPPHLIHSKDYPGLLWFTEHCPGLQSTERCPGLQNAVLVYRLLVYSLLNDAVSFKLKRSNVDLSFNLLMSSRRNIFHENIQMHLRLIEAYIVKSKSK